jgi:NRAMP (natural resistance-associated macrophage protein)-like metal ion transporter
MENGSTAATSKHETKMASPKNILRSVGPGLVTACVVIGPGSILTSSKVGATDGYCRVWVVVLAVFFMMTYTTLAARLGTVTRQSAGDLVSSRAGRWLAVIIGSGVFFISAAFQFGNNLGVHSALAAYVEFDYWIVAFNAVAITFIFAFRNLYGVVERLMACLVGVMLASFAANLWFARPDWVALGTGLVPFGGSTEIGLPLLGLVGTTFVMTAAYYQSYLVRFKGWSKSDLTAGLIDARVGSVIMLLITLMIMATAAAVLRGKELASVSDVAYQLQPLFGEKGRAIFCIGLFCAAFSSFIVNSMIGGFILADALKLGNTPEKRGPRILTVSVLLIGMVVALYVIKTGAKPVGAIVAAQAVTVIASPLMAIALLWLTNLSSVMGEHRNGIWLNLAAGAGLVLLILMAWYTATQKVWPAIQNVFSP